jgi:hypothetical protein
VPNQKQDRLTRAKSMASTLTACETNGTRNGTGTGTRTRRIKDSHTNCDMKKKNSAIDGHASGSPHGLLLGAISSAVSVERGPVPSTAWLHGLLQESNISIPMLSIGTSRSLMFLGSRRIARTGLSSRLPAAQQSFVKDCLFAGKNDSPSLRHFLCLTT